MPVDYLGFADRAGIPFDRMMNAANLGLRMRALRQQEAQREAKSARQAEMKTAMQKFSESPMGIEDYTRIMTSYPELTQQLRLNYDMQSKAQQDSDRKQALELYSALQSPDPSTANQVLDTRIAAAQNTGDEPGVAMLTDFKNQVAQNPRAAKAMAGLSLAASMGPKEFANTLKALEGSATTGAGVHRDLTFEEYQKLTRAQKQEYDVFKGRKQPTPSGELSFAAYKRLSPEQRDAYDRYKGRSGPKGVGDLTFEEYRKLDAPTRQSYDMYKGRTPDPKDEITFQEYQALNPQQRRDYDSFKGRGTGKTFEVLTKEQADKLGLPKGAWQMEVGSNRVTPLSKAGMSVTVNNVPRDYMPDEVDAKGNVISVKPIPGGPAALKAAELTRKKNTQAGVKTRYGNIVISDIQRLRKKVVDAPWYDPVTGIWASMIKDVEGTSRSDAEQLRAAIVANIGFERLEQMREASTTGGALGSVTEKEIELLQSVLGSLTLKQSKDQLLENLNRLEKIYSDMLQKIQAYPNASEFGYVDPSNSQTAAAPAQAPVSPSTGPATRPGSTLAPGSPEAAEYLRNRSYMKLLRPKQ